MKKVDINTWKRKEIFEFFSSVAYPYYSVTFTLDVSRVYSFVKEHGLSFYYCMCWLCTQAINRVEAFGYLIKGGDIYRLDKRHPSFTDIKKGEELFYIVTMPIQDDVVAFCREAAERSGAQTCFINMSSETDELVYLSCTPALSITALTNEHDSGKDDAIPRIAWGKYRDVNGRKELGLSVEVNHRFIDGYHIGKFAEELEKLISEL